MVSDVFFMERYREKSQYLPDMLEVAEQHHHESSNY